MQITDYQCFIKLFLCYIFYNIKINYVTKAYNKVYLKKT